MPFARLHSQVFGFLYSEYRHDLYYWGSVAQAQTFALVATQVFSMVLSSVHQVTLMLLALMSIAAIEAVFQPSQSIVISQLKFASSTVLALTLGLSFFAAKESIVMDVSQEVSFLFFTLSKW